MQLQHLRTLLTAASCEELADELLNSYDGLKTRYFRRDFRPGELEGGRFAEGAFRILQLQATGSYAPLDKQLPPVPQLLATLEGADPKTVHDSVRIHIPRALAAVYNVRNRRDVGHIAADVDANSMDAEYVVANCNWVLAEFVRLFHQCSPEEAQAYVESIVKRRAPLIQMFGKTPFVTKSDPSARDEILLLLYHQGQLGAALSDLDAWMPTVTRKVISARLSELEREARYVRRLDGQVFISDPGIEYVEDELLGG